MRGRHPNRLLRLLWFLILAGPLIPLGAQAAEIILFLHSTGSDFLDTTNPTATTAKFKDSPGVNFKNGNPWRDIATWSDAPSLSTATLTTLSTLHVWLGLKNSDDQGTSFDLRAEILKNGMLVASGETQCIEVYPIVKTI